MPKPAASTCLPLIHSACQAPLKPGTPAPRYQKEELEVIPAGEHTLRRCTGGHMVWVARNPSRVECEHLWNEALARSEDSRLQPRSQDAGAPGHTRHDSSRGSHRPPRVLSVQQDGRGQPTCVGLTASKLFCMWTAALDTFQVDPSWSPGSSTHVIWLLGTWEWTRRMVQDDAQQHESLVLPIWD